MSAEEAEPTTNAGAASTAATPSESNEQVCEAKRCIAEIREYLETDSVVSPADTAEPTPNAATATAAPAADDEALRRENESLKAEVAQLRRDLEDARASASPAQAEPAPNSREQSPDTTDHADGEVGVWATPSRTANDQGVDESPPDNSASKSDGSFARTRRRKAQPVHVQASASSPNRGPQLSATTVAHVIAKVTSPHDRSLSPSRGVSPVVRPVPRTQGARIDNWNALAGPPSSFSKRAKFVAAPEKAPSLRRPYPAPSDDKRRSPSPNTNGALSTNRVTTMRFANATSSKPPVNSQGSRSPSPYAGGNSSMVRDALAPFKKVAPGEELTMERNSSEAVPPRSDGRHVRIERSAVR